MKVSKLSSFYFPLKLYIQNILSVEKRTLLQVITFMPLNYFLRFNRNHRARPSPFRMLKVHCLERQFCNQLQRCHYAVIIWLVILSFTYLTEREDVAETKKENILMLLPPSSHLAIHLPFPPNGFLFYKCPFKDLIHQFYDL